MGFGGGCGGELVRSLVRWIKCLATFSLSWQSGNKIGGSSIRGLGLAKGATISEKF